MSRFKEFLSPIGELAKKAPIYAGIASAYVGLAFDLAKYESAGFSPFGAKTPSIPTEKLLPIPTTAEALAAATRIAVTLLGKYGTSAKIRVDDKTGDVILTTSD